MFRSALLKEAAVVEDQVRQTPRGADIFVIGSIADQSAAARTIAAELARMGVDDPAVAIRTVDRLERQPTGKVRRFLPMH